MKLVSWIGTSMAVAATAAALGAAGPAAAAEVKLTADLSQRSIASGKTRTVYLRIGLEGIAAAGGAGRAPVNVALVIDRSGSMEAENKIGNAREAALMALGRLGSDDIASVVAYNHAVDVLLPATKLTDREEITRSIDKLTADGNTALYAGTEQGIVEVGKFQRSDRVNRVILVSDGLANVGPASPEELGALGRKAAAKGITITTIGLGLGYNEDLMAKLAYNSDGNHAFVERADQLVDIFNKEFGDVLSVVAQELIIRIKCGDGFKPIRTLGREAEISGSTVTTRLNQLYGKQQKYVVVELAVPADAKLGSAAVAGVEVEYSSLGAAQRATLQSAVTAEFTTDTAAADASLEKTVMIDVTTQIANETNEKAVELRDKGDIAGAKQLLEENASYLQEAAKSLAAPTLDAFAGSVASDAAAIEGDWERTRKAMRAVQHKNKVQQSY